MNMNVERGLLYFLKSPGEVKSTSFIACTDILSMSIGIFFNLCTGSNIQRLARISLPLSGGLT